MESQGLAELRLIFFGKNGSRDVKNGSRNLLRSNEVAPAEDLLLACLDGGAAFPLLSRGGRGQDSGGDPRGVARLARSESGPGTPHVLSPRRPLDLDLEARRPRARLARLRGHRRRLRRQQPAGQGRRGSAPLPAFEVARAPLLSPSPLYPARAGLRRSLRHLLLSSGDGHRRNPLRGLSPDRPAGGGPPPARRGRRLRGLPEDADRAPHGAGLEAV